MIRQTEQSILEYENDTVLKTYKKGHILFDKKYFESEVDALSKLSSNSYFVDVFDIGDCSYKMKRHNFSLGTADRINHVAISRLLFSVRIDDVLKNLDAILAGLRENHITHRDINPGNLLYCDRERLLKLTDFFWCSANGNMPLPMTSDKHPWPVNGKYGTDDFTAIEKIKTEIKTFHDFYFVERYEAIRDEFLVTVGCGEYKDGSSVFNGFAYHIVDIPQFKKSIKYHKDTCVNEYKTIKNNLPIEPKSFIDIGMSCGYFSFNLMRDFDIHRCTGYEVDGGVNKFLCSVKNLYSLEEININGKFDQTTEIAGDYDIAIFLNSHMWIHKQIGPIETLGCVTNILNHCRWMFFQTCGAYSSGMYRVMEYRTPQDIKDMLIKAGGKDVKTLDVFIGSHDAPRHMFLVRGQVE